MDEHKGSGEGGDIEPPEAEAIRDKVLKLVRECYGGGRGERLGPTLATEHLAAEHGLVVDHETLRRWMLADRRWSKERQRRQHRKWRERRAHFGELVQMDGSFHAWPGIRMPVECLLDMVDDATSQTDGRFTPEETIWAAADARRRWVERPRTLETLCRELCTPTTRTCTCATPAEELRGEVALTQFGAMCQKLGFKIIAAGSPQAKGRIERGHGTHQDRMVKKMRLQGIGATRRRTATWRRSTEASTTGGLRSSRARRPTTTDRCPKG